MKRKQIAEHWERVRLNQIEVEKERIKAECIAREQAKAKEKLVRLSEVQTLERKREIFGQH